MTALDGRENFDEEEKIVNVITNQLDSLVAVAVVMNASIDAVDPS